MTLRRVAVLVGMVTFMLAGSAAAQVPMMGNLPSFDNAPAAPPPGAGPPAMGAPMGGPPPGAGPSRPGAGAGQEDPCFKEFLPLREAAEKRAAVIRAAAERKAPREEVCQLFKTFAVTEAKVIKFVTEKQSVCHIPEQAVSQMKANHDRTMKTKENVCAAGPAAGPAGPPPGPRLSDELGVRGVAAPTNTTPGRGTFDTLSGSALSR